MDSHRVLSTPGDAELAPQLVPGAILIISRIGSLPRRYPPCNHFVRYRTLAVALLQHLPQIFTKARQHQLKK
jgi:hypothetical protein